jgi:hypothetical protein
MTAIDSFNALAAFLAANPPLELATAASPATGQTQHQARYVPLGSDVEAYFRRITSEAILDRASDAELRELDLTYKPEPGTVEWVALEHVPAVQDACSQYADMNELSNFVPGDDTYKKQLRFWVARRDADGKRAFFFRSFSKTAELKRKKGAAVFLRDGSFELLDQQIFLFDENVDCVVYEDYIYVLRRDDYRRVFDQLDQVRQAAEAAAASLNERVPIKNFDEFAKACARQPAMADKIIAVQRRDYFSRLSYEMLEPVMEEFELPIEVDDSDGTPRLVFATGPNDRWRILRLVDDDYLASAMTEHKYEVNSKSQKDKP